MKIRHQFVLLLILLAAIPILYFVGQAIHNYVLISQRALYEKTKAINLVERMDLSEEDKKLLVETIKNRPLDTDFAFMLTDGTILFSTIPQLEEKQTIDMNDFIKLVGNPNDGMLYQTTTLPAQSSGMPLILITKFPEYNFSKHRRTVNAPASVRYTIISFTIVFEFICIFFAFLISHRISKSITLLEKNTEQLADGNFETPISIPKGFFLSNEITALTENLETVRLALKDLQRRRDRLIMGISHDLRTPISIIKGYSEAMTDGLVKNKQKAKEALRLIQSKTEQLDEMIETLINFVKLNSSDWSKNLEKIDFGEFMEKRVNYSKSTCEIFNRYYFGSFNIPRGLIVKMDPQLVERAFANLLSNAIRYSKDGDTIYTKGYVKNNAVLLSIRDTGIGIAKEELDQIFDIFYKASPSRSGGGMGIGLAVVKNIIETHGWSIDVESELGKGTEFTITIPLNPAGHKKNTKAGVTFIS